jgi:hypothetical protein
MTVMWSSWNLEAVTLKGATNTRVSTLKYFPHSDEQIFITRPPAACNRETASENKPNVLNRRHIKVMSCQ